MAHVSSADSVRLVREAKRRGLPVTCGVSINHLTLNENDIGDYRTFFQLSPPLRAEDDRRGDGRGRLPTARSTSSSPRTIRRMSTPSACPSPMRPMAPSGSRRCWPLALRLYHNRRSADAPDRCAVWSRRCQPARHIFSASKAARCKAGAPADLVLFDPDEPWVVDKDDDRSRSKNTPSTARGCRAGKVMQTMVAGARSTTLTLIARQADSIAIGTGGLGDLIPCQTGRLSAALSTASGRRPRFGYLLGSIPFGLMLTRLAGHAATSGKIGSGNIGATNVLRTGNKKLAAATLLLDMLKGTAAGADRAVWRRCEAALIAGLGAFLGHLFPVWLGFKGGKGVATYLGVLLGAGWPVGWSSRPVWLATALIFRYSSLSALLGRLRRSAAAHDRREARVAARPLFAS